MTAIKHENSKPLGLNFIKGNMRSTEKKNCKLNQYRQFWSIFYRLVRGRQIAIELVQIKEKNPHLALNVEYEGEAKNLNRGLLTTKYYH